MSFEKICPWTGFVTNRYFFVESELIEDSLKSLNLGFLSWKNLSVQERQHYLQVALQRLQQKKQSLSQLITTEMGKPITQSIAEVEKCIQSFQFFLQKDLSFLHSKKITIGSVDHHLRTEPLGIIYSIMPWNFPLWQVIRMVVPALLAGNTILLKHSEVTPQIGIEIESLFANIFEHLVLKNLLISHNLTEAVISDARVGGVSLTGSTKAGMVIAQIAAQYLKKSVLELGGSDAYIVSADANLQLAAQQITQSRLQNTGQSCIAAKRCLVERSVQDELMDLLKAEYQNYQYGPVEQAQTTLGPLAHPRLKKAYLEQRREFLAATKAQLIQSVACDFATAESAYVDAEIYYISQNSVWLKSQEFFAPLLVVMPYQSVEEAVALANSTDYGLGAGVWSQDIDWAQKIADQLNVGQVAVNSFIKSDAQIPFGGMKKSGWGRELGEQGFCEFTQTRVISTTIK